MPLRRIALLLTLGVALSATATSAQSLGTFRWQLQPYCNVVTVTVTQRDGVYLLDGVDDRCGGGNQPGSAVGIAYPTPLGLVGFGWTTVLPGGIPVHTEATITLASLNGTWRDSAGNVGTFTFGPAVPTAGSQRPVSTTGLAPASVTNVLIAPGAVTGSTVADNSLTSADILDGARSQFASRIDFVPLGSTGSPPTNLRSVTINAPAPGKVIVLASGFFDFGSAAQDDGRCEITTSSTAIDNDFAFYGAEGTGATTAMVYVPFGSTRGFNVPAGTTTFNLLCDRVLGTVGVWRAHLTAIYTPQ
jgi:hypothetical protein